ncbi:MAG: YihY/virulence factor BrkB family protein [bacterium]
MTRTLPLDLKGTRDFLQTGVWRIRARLLPPRKSFLLRQLRILLLALRRYRDDRCQLRASALTFYSLLSVVPILAMAFGVAKGFGFERRLEKQILEAFPDHRETAIQIVRFANSLLEQTQGGLIAGIGVVVLFWTVIKVLGNIETSFNDIWGVKKGRSFERQFSDYLSIMLVAPILLVVASSVTVFAISQVEAVSRISFLGTAGSLVLSLLKLLPYCVIWCLFTFLYVMIPNTKVKIRSGLLGGIIAGTVFQVVQWVYIQFQIGVSSYGAIYGSFAALPLFLVWLQTSWLIVLFGAEISFAEQNVETYEFELDCGAVSRAFKRLVALRVAHLCVRNFECGLRAPGAEEIAESLGLPIRLIRDAVFELTESGILTEAGRGSEKAVGYQPARSISTLTLKSVIQRLESRGTDTIPIDDAPEWGKLAEHLERFEKDLEESPANIALKDL